MAKTVKIEGSIKNKYKALTLAELEKKAKQEKKTTKKKKK